MLPLSGQCGIEGEWCVGFAADPALDLDAREHGVAGDGMSDDTAAFATFLAQAIASPGALLRIPRGIYRFDGEVLVPIPPATIDPTQQEEPHEP